jgi:hypothetical protein
MALQQEQGPTSEAASHDLVWGVVAIAQEINRNSRQTYHLLESRRLPAKKVGNRWCSSKTALRRFFAAQFTEAE